MTIFCLPPTTTQLNSFAPNPWSSSYIYSISQPQLELEFAFACKPLDNLKTNNNFTAPSHFSCPKQRWKSIRNTKKAFKKTQQSNITYSRIEYVK